MVLRSSGLCEKAKLIILHQVSDSRPNTFYYVSSASKRGGSISRMYETRRIDHISAKPCFQTSWKCPYPTFLLSSLSLFASMPILNLLSIIKAQDFGKYTNQTCLFPDYVYAHLQGTWRTCFYKVIYNNNISCLFAPGCYNKAKPNRAIWEKLNSNY